MRPILTDLLGIAMDAIDIRANLQSFDGGYFWVAECSLPDHSWEALSAMESDTVYETRQEAWKSWGQECATAEARLILAAAMALQIKQCEGKGQA